MALVNYINVTACWMWITIFGPLSLISLAFDDVLRKYVFCDDVTKTPLNIEIFLNIGEGYYRDLDLEEYPELQRFIIISFWPILGLVKLADKIKSIFRFKRMDLDR